MCLHRLNVHVWKRRRPDAKQKIISDTTGGNDRGGATEMTKPTDTSWRIKWKTQHGYVLYTFFYIENIVIYIDV